MQIRYIHQKLKPLLPAIGDIRIVPELMFKNAKNEADRQPEAKFHVAKCVRLEDHHVFYEFVGEDVCEAIPFEMAEKYGFLSMDLAIRWIIDSYMKYVMETEKQDSTNMFVVGNCISEYFTKLQFLVGLSKQTLKEAEETKNLFQKYISKNQQQKKKGN